MSRSCYLAGPMRNLPRYNFDAFDAAAYALRQDGWTVQSPAEHDRSMGFNPDGSLEGFDLSAAMAWDLQQVLDTDCIIILPGWESSTGCHYELSACHALGKPVFQYPEMTPVELPGIVTDPVGSSKRVGSKAQRARFSAEQADYAHVRGVDGPGAYAHVRGVEVPGARSSTPPARYTASEVKVPYSDRDLRPDLFPGPGEVRVVDPTTGGAKGSKPCQMGALDPVGLEQMGLVAGMGSIKYDRFNFLKGYKWSLSVDALYRHLLSFLAGEDSDPESGLPHMAHAAWHAHALTGFLKRGIGTDDRPPR